MKKILILVKGVLLSSILAIVLCSFSVAEAASSQNYQYDQSGRLVSIIFSKYKVTFKYDNNGNMLQHVIAPIK